MLGDDVRHRLVGLSGGPDPVEVFVDRGERPFAETGDPVFEVFPHLPAVAIDAINEPETRKTGPILRSRTARSSSAW